MTDISRDKREAADEVLPNGWQMINDAGVSPDTRSPGLTAEGMAVTDGREEEEKALARELWNTFHTFHGEAAGGWRRCARFVLSRFPAVLSTDGDQSLAAETQALRKALADANEAKARVIGELAKTRAQRAHMWAQRVYMQEQRNRLLERLPEEARIDADTYRVIRRITGDHVGARTIIGAVQHVVNEREAWKSRALTSERAKDDAEQALAAVRKALVGGAA